MRNFLYLFQFLSLIKNLRILFNFIIKFVFPQQNCLAHLQFQADIMHFHIHRPGFTTS